MTWPEQVLVLDDTCNISGPYGIKTSGNPHDSGFLQAEQYPNYLNEWTNFFFRDAEGNSNHITSLEFTTTLLLSGRWITHIITNNNHGKVDHEFFRITTLKRGRGPAHFNYRARMYYNLAWAYHDYEPYPEPIPELLAYMKDSILFQELVAGTAELAKTPYKQTTKKVTRAKTKTPKRSIFTIV